MLLAGAVCDPFRRDPNVFENAKIFSTKYDEYQFSGIVTMFLIMFAYHCVKVMWHETLTGLRSVLVQVLNRYFNSEEDIFKERIVFYTTGSTESSDNQNTVLVLVLVWGARLSRWKYGARINVG